MNTIVYSKAMAGVNSAIIKRCYSRCPLNFESQKLLFSCTKNIDNNLRRQIDSTSYEASLQKFSLTQNRNFTLTPRWCAQESSSKVEDTVKSLKEDKEEKDKTTVVASNDASKKAEQAIVEKRTMWQKVKAEMVHYYHGFRLLGLDMKVSAKLIWRVLHGNELTRREHKLLVKTTGNMFRLIPFSVFIVVPFMELLLPVFIKVFPGMLPSTFQTATDKEDKLKQALKVKIEMAKFLQKTLDDMAVQSSDHRSVKAKEFAEFFQKMRSTGHEASNQEIMKFSKLFEDEITLDSLSRAQLIALCRVLDVQTLGTTNFLRFLLRMRLRNLAADDRLIEKEGVDTLERAELQQACRARGMRAYGMPENRLRDQLSQWLDLSINQKVPPSLLLLSRALMVPDTMPMEEKLKVTISSLPDDVLARTKGSIGEKEGKIDHKTNIEIIKLEEKRILEEREENKESIQPEPIVSSSSSSSSINVDDKKDEITTNDVKVLEQALDSIGEKKMAVEKEELKELKEEMAEYQEDIQELAQITSQSDADNAKDLQVSKGAKRLYNKVNKMINKMDVVLGELEKSEMKVKEKIETLKSEDKSDDKVVEESVKIDELIGAIKQIQNIPDDARLARIEDILGKIDDDRDGAIKIEDVLKVIEMIGKEDVKLSKKQVTELIDLIDKEEVLEVEDQIQKALTKENKDKEASPVPSTPVTKADKPLKEEFDEEKNTKINIKTSAGEELHDSAPVLKDSKKTIKNTSISGVPPSNPKKAEGSKHL
ncbi:hypothetical protein HCN44_009698 [Aphidius gifuensis]|uniref:Mitochondrial proton/calcium exchanger protein n=1 Tax=Aphidius gifuensis TaxID=684658 RepID=A0A835CZ51_APHGI|nr:mitochondrial proton/calcium exchanger protein [Aphidius gifuensis]KAF7998300.1 hypothetical protein HCN44_009698 [Aphidius gifuensis]